MIDQAAAVSKPVISGTAQEGVTLTASASGSESDWAVSYQWQRDGGDITGATGASYVVKEEDEGHKLDVVATARTATGRRRARPATRPRNADQAAAVSAGDQRTAGGRQLTAKPAAARRLGSQLSVAARRRRRHRRHRVRLCRQGGDEATSSTLSPHTNSSGRRRARPATRPRPWSTSPGIRHPGSITGTAQEGQVLTAVNSTLNDSAAAVTGYQWTLNGSTSPAQPPRPTP